MSKFYEEIFEFAVLAACEDELDRLCYEAEVIPPTLDEVGESISKGLTHLGNLQSGKKPDYSHPWVPLLHASWFHLRHVNFLQTVLAAQLRKHANSDELRIVDFGCGTMPVMWAIALALADSNNNLTHQKIIIHNYDQSKEMKMLGECMWLKLDAIIGTRKNHREGRMLHNAIKRIKLSNTKLTSPNLLTAIHCLYDKQTCNTIKNAPIADKCVILHRSKVRELNLQHVASVTAKWSGDLEKLTKFRHETIGYFCQHNFLNRPVKWDNRDAVLVDL